MKIEPHSSYRGNGFLIMKGGTAFNFFVDVDSASWTRTTSAHLFRTKEAAEECITEIKRRDALRRKNNNYPK